MRNWSLLVGLALLVQWCTMSQAGAQDADFKSFGELGNRAYGAGHYEEAEKNYNAALQTADKSSSKQLQVGKAKVLTNLGATYYMEGKYEQAERAYNDSLSLKEQLLGKNSPQVADTLKHLAQLMRKQKRKSEAEQYDLRAELIEVQENAAKMNSENFTASTGSGLAAPGHLSGSGSTTASAPLAATTQGNRTKILHLYQMSYHDKLMLSDTLKASVESPIYTGASLHKQAYEKLKNHLDFVRDIAFLDTRYRLNPTITQNILTAIYEGGTALELQNGWLMLSSTELHGHNWQLGEVVMVRPSSGSTESTYIIRSPRSQSEITAKLLAEL